MMWTEERVTLLRKLWGEGHSAAQVARQLGEVTRNAVIGKIHRLGLSGRTTPSRPARRVAAPSRPREVGRPMNPRLRANPVAGIEETLKLEPLLFGDGRAANVLSVKDSMCKFPIGDPSEQGFAFCGRTTSCGPYCSDHARVAYQSRRAR